MAHILCKNCHNQIENDMQFCPFCGTSVPSFTGIRQTAASGKSHHETLKTAPAMRAKKVKKQYVGKAKFSNLASRLFFIVLLYLVPFMVYSAITYYTFTYSDPSAITTYDFLLFQTTANASYIYEELYARFSFLLCSLPVCITMFITCTKSRKGISVSSYVAIVICAFAFVPLELLVVFVHGDADLLLNKFFIYPLMILGFIYQIIAISPRKVASGTDKTPIEELRHNEDLLTDLREYKTLLDEGILSRKEFEKIKRKLLP